MNKRRISEEPREQFRDVSMRLAIIFPVNKRQDIARFHLHEFKPHVLSPKSP